MRRLLRSYAEQMSALLARLLPPYAGHWRTDTTSFRPCEEDGRALPGRVRNDLLHVDAFPSRPTNGDRILRLFTNLHPTRARRWVTGEPFDALVPRFADRRTAPPGRRSPWQWLRRRLIGRAPASWAPLVGRSPYDVFMLRLHDRLKADARFQAAAPRRLHEFPPASSWIAFTDFVPHAVLAGQFALEQTYVVPYATLLRPERAPLSLLERRYGRCLTDRRPGGR